MRSFVWLGLLANMACGIDTGGLGPLQDAAVTPDAPSMDDVAVGLDEGGRDAGGPPIADGDIPAGRAGDPRDSGRDGDALAAPDGRGVDAMVPPADDGGDAAPD